jgi:uncharacterized protein YdaU (DUF1376 family)
MNAVLFYINDFLGSSRVALMSNEQVGCYVFLLLRQAAALDGFLPADEAALAKLARVPLAKWRRICPEILECFEPPSDGKIYNDRMRLEWERQTAYQESRSDSARKAAKTRWGGNANAMRSHMRTHDPGNASGDADAMRTQCVENANSSSSSKSSSPASVVAPTSVDSKAKKTNALSPDYNHKALYDRLVAIYPPGHNPRPDFAFQMLMSKLDVVSRSASEIPECGDQMVTDLRDKWLPRMKPEGWQIPPDLHNWISRWEPGADVAPDPEPETQAERIGRELEEEANAEKPARAGAAE